MKTIVIFAILFCSIISLKGQKNPEEVVDSFFTYFNSKGVERSLQYVFATNKYLKQNPEIVTNLKAKFDKALPVLGTFYRYEKYMHKQVGSTFAHIGYLMVVDRQPTKIIFTLYYASDHWQIQDLRFDDKIDDVIKELPNLVK